MSLLLKTKENSTEFCPRVFGNITTEKEELAPLLLNLYYRRTPTARFRFSGAALFARSQGLQAIWEVEQT
ncbi:hypothetical protein ACS0TY_016718 [Phlomoides rotata]